MQPNFHSMSRKQGKKNLTNYIVRNSQLESSLFPHCSFFHPDVRNAIPFVCLFLVPFLQGFLNRILLRIIFLVPHFIEYFQVKPENDEWDNWFSEQDKELQQIFQGQSDMKDVLNELHRKMDEIIGRQERTLSVISAQVRKYFSV